MDQKHPVIILASSSPRRRALLATLGIDFAVVVSGADEDHFEALTPEEMVVELAVRKAAAVAKATVDGLVLGADTTVAVDGEWLGKPADGDDAAKMLRRLSGRVHDVFTGVALVDARSGDIGTRIVASRVAIRPLSRFEIDAYVATGESLDKAGAYGIQGFGRSLVASVDGCFNNVVGLPLCAVNDLFASQKAVLAERRPACRLERGEPCPEIAGMERARWG